MFTKPEPKNKNITIRVTNKQFKAFNNMAYKNGLSRSEWGYHSLFKHKNNYRRRDRLIHNVDIEDVKTALIHRLLKKFQIPNTNLFSETQTLEIKQIELAIKILDMTTFKSDDAIDEIIRDYRSSVHRLLL